MIKQLVILAMAVLLPACANAQFLKKLGKALDKVNNTLNGISGQSGQNNSNKVGYITYQEEASFVNNWGSMELVGAVGNAETGALQVVIRIKPKNGKHYSVKADKVKGPNGEQLVENKNWTRGDWTLTDAANGVFVSPVWVVPTSYKSLSHVCVVTFLGDIWADIYNIPIEWRQPQAQSQAASSSLPAITQRRFCGVGIGMPLKNVPATVNGIYSRRMESSYGCDGTQYECYDGNDNVLSFIDEDDNGKIDCILVMKQGVRIDGTQVYIGMSESSLKSISGVRFVNDGSEYYKYGSYNISCDTDGRVCMIEIR